MAVALCVVILYTLWFLPVGTTGTGSVGTQRQRDQTEFAQTHGIGNQMAWAIFHNGHVQWGQLQFIPAAHEHRSRRGGWERLNAPGKTCMTAQASPDAPPFGAGCGNPVQSKVSPAWLVRTPRPFATLHSSRRPASLIWPGGCEISSRDPVSCMRRHCAQTGGASRQTRAGIF